MGSPEVKKEADAEPSGPQGPRSFHLTAWPSSGNTMCWLNKINQELSWRPPAFFADFYTWTKQIPDRKEKQGSTVTGNHQCLLPTLYKHFAKCAKSENTKWWWGWWCQPTISIGLDTFWLPFGKGEFSFFPFSWHLWLLNEWSNSFIQFGLITGSN